MGMQCGVIHKEAEEIRLVEPVGLPVDNDTAVFVAQRYDMSFNKGNMDSAGTDNEPVVYAVGIKAFDLTQKLSG